MNNYNNSISARLTARHKKSMQLCEVQNKKILDIGCSIGWFESYAIKSNCENIVAIDVNINDIVQARHNQSDVHYIISSANNLTFIKEYFDLIVLFDVMEHLPKRTEKQLLKDIFEMLKKNGELVLSVPNDCIISKLFDPAWYFGHRHYTKNFLLKILTRSDFKIDLVSYGGGIYELLSMILLYFFKYFLKKEVPYKSFFENKRNDEYLNNKGRVATIFIKTTKQSL